MIKSDMLRFYILAFLSLLFSLADSVAQDSALRVRKHLQMVGSSTVYPFAATIAEEFGRNSSFKTPIVEAVGTGGGFKLFCQGVGYDFPDFANASRKIEASEVKKCHENNVKEIGEIKIGYDGIVLANSVAGQKFSLTKSQVFLALSDKIIDEKTNKLINNPYKKWNEIDARLPALDIVVYGPPISSGTRDAFVELVMEEGCKNLKEYVAAFPDQKIRKKNCSVVRSDGRFIEAGENDNLIVQKLRNDPNALGIFGFSFLEENHNLIQAAVIENAAPSFANITSGVYPVARPLYIYYKKQHVALIKGMREFLLEIVSKDTIGNDGYLLQKGLIPLVDLELKKTRDELINGL